MVKYGWRSLLLNIMYTKVNCVLCSDFNMSMIMHKTVYFHLFYYFLMLILCLYFFTWRIWGTADGGIQIFKSHPYQGKYNPSSSRWCFYLFFNLIWLLEFKVSVNISSIFICLKNVSSQKQRDFGTYWLVGLHLLNPNWKKRQSEEGHQFW